MLWDKDIPEPDAPPEPIEPELERLLTFFIRKNRRISWNNGMDRTILYFEGKNVNGKEKEPYECKIKGIRE